MSISYSLAFVSTAVLARVMSPLAQRVGLTDRPTERKRHQGSIPLTGGVAMFGGFSGALLASGTAGVATLPMLAGSALLVLVGLLDDLRGLPPSTRFTAQVVAALIICYGGGVVLQDLGHLSSGAKAVQLGTWAIPFTVFATVGVINAMNFSDGMDGLGGGLALIALVSLAGLAWAAGRSDDFHTLVLLILAVSAFLLFNLRLPGQPRARVFMGNSGSMFLGLAIAWFTIKLSQPPAPAMTPVTALWIFALPLIDTVSMMLRRLWLGRSPLSGDREHYHHVLVQAGHSVPKALLRVLWLATLCAAVGIGGLYRAVPEAYLLYSFLCLTALYFSGLMWVWKVRRFLGRAIERRAIRSDRRGRLERRKVKRDCELERRLGSDRRSGLERRG